MRSHAAGLVVVALAAAALSEEKAMAERQGTVAEARAFVDGAEERLAELWIDANRASWVQATYITEDTEILAAKANAAVTAATVELAKQARRFDGVELPGELRRKIELLRRALTVPAPSDPEAGAALSRLAAKMESDYGRARYCPPGATECLGIERLERIVAESRDPSRLREVWEGWRAQFPSMREDFRRYVELANRGARELGFADVGELWRSKYDMPPDELARELDRLWGQLRPLYVSLHAYVRRRLRETYGPEVVPATGPIPAHLLGNMWAQSWIALDPLVAPPGAEPGYDLTERLRAKGLDPVEMVRTGERFFLSLGFEPLPETFWRRSLFTRPRDRDVVCHASAWNIDDQDDLRIKMCIEVDAEDFQTIHHELGHNFYQRAYKHLSPLFRAGANDGFHEAIGDTIALSVTPRYLVRIGLLDREPEPERDIGLLLRMALDKLAFLPFGLLVDEWRWKVFSGEVPPERYNRAWWELRERYQGVAPPAPRGEEAFDPGAKYHVAASVPYARYFLAHILQFQFHRALCREAGYEGPLHRCTIFGSARAGERLRRMLALGQSRPWPEALETLTGERRLDAGALVEYFRPLAAWLDEQNEGQPVGW